MFCFYLWYTNDRVKILFIYFYLTTNTPYAHTYFRRRINKRQYIFDRFFSYNIIVILSVLEKKKRIAYFTFIVFVTSMYVTLLMCYRTTNGLKFNFGRFYQYFLRKPKKKLIICLFENIQIISQVVPVRSQAREKSV